MRRFVLATVLVAWVACPSDDARADELFTMQDGLLQVKINQANGAISHASFNGVEYFHWGNPVSSWGLQNGTDTTTFVINSPSGGMQTVTGSGAAYSGTFTGGGSNVSFHRNYTLLSGLNVLRIDNTFINNGSPLDLAYFDTFDPDMGMGLGFYPNDYGNSSDRFLLSGIPVAQAWLNRYYEGNSYDYAFLLGSPDSRAVVGNSPRGDLGIHNGGELNGFLLNQNDNDGGFGDQGENIGLRTYLATGETTSFSTYLAFGHTREQVQNAFLAAVTPVPEPSTLAMFFGLGGMGLLAAFRRRKRAY